AQPERLRDRIVIAGPIVPAYRTSIGVLSAPELLAQVVAGYLEDRRVAGGAFGSAIAWTAAGLLIALGCLRPPLSRSAIVLTGGTAALGLLAGAGTLFTALDFWLPVAGPVAWVSIAAAAFGL